MPDPARQISYLVGTPKGKIRQYEKKWLDLPWQKVRESVEVKLFEQDGELYVLAKSEGRRAKETAMRRKRLAGLLRKLRASRRSLPCLVQLPMRLGAAKAEAGRAFQFRVDKKKLQQAEWQDGHYLLRSNLAAEDPGVLWTRYVQLTKIESVFRSLKNDLGIRPLYHQLEHRADAHILIAFLAYCLLITLKHRLLLHAPGLTLTAVLEKLAEIKMIDVWIPTVDQRWLILPRYTQPSLDTKLLIEKMKLQLPSQPPPRLAAQKESYEINVQTVP
jgi:hypothetical protein